MKIKLTDAYRDPLNARGKLPSKREIDVMAGSLEAVGQLQPIKVRRAEKEKGWLVTIGWTRVLAAKQLGWKEIDGDELPGNLDAGMVSAAENMVRNAMHPVDQWRHIGRMQSRGVAFDAAAVSLGLSVREAKAMSYLGNMAPAVLDALAREEVLPSWNYLRTIAASPHKAQEAAMREAKRITGSDVIDWLTVARRCERKAIPRAAAIFDVESAGVVFDEDLLASEGSPEQFTTIDIDSFMAAQRKALLERIEASKTRACPDGRLIPMSFDEYNNMRTPAGYRASYENIPKRWRTDDDRRVAVGIIPAGFNIGVYAERLVVPIRKTAETQRSLDQDDTSPAAESRERGPYTKATLARFAALKGDAVRAALDSWKIGNAESELHIAVRMLLLMLGADNVSIRDTTQLYGTHSYGYMTRRLINDDGLPATCSTKILMEIVAQMVGRAVCFPHPNAIVHSGAYADWIANLADARAHLPRFDTEDILKGCSHDTLKTVAREANIDISGTRGALIKRMTGNLPDWHPVDFVSEPPPAPIDEEFDEVEPDPEPEPPPAPRKAPARKAAAKKKAPAKKKGKR